MVPIPTLLLPILLAAVFVFVASSIIHMLLPYHRTDFGKLPAESDVLDALRKFNLPPGDYMVPRPAGPEDMKSAEFKDKLMKGPVLIMTVMKPGPMNMGSNLIQWFVYCVVVSVLAAYITGRAVGPGATNLQVIRFAGATAFIAYAVGLWQHSIWYKQKWSTSFKNTIDGLIYGVLTGLAFCIMWPKS
jgi:hypothetical protein